MSQTVAKSQEQPTGNFPFRLSISFARKSLPRGQWSFVAMQLRLFKSSLLTCRNKGL